MAHDQTTSIPAGQLSEAASLGGSAAPATAARFQDLAVAWQKATAHMSCSSDKVADPSFQAIVGMGPAVIPMLLRELANKSGHWHRALQRITGVDPVPPADRGSLDKITAAWLRWGQEQGYSW